MNQYISPQTPPSEAYWQAILTEGRVSLGRAPGDWEWAETIIRSPQAWQEAQKLFRNHTVLELEIDSFNRGGLIAHWRGSECFIPASHLLDYPFPANPTARESIFQKYVGKKMKLCIIEVEPVRNRILLSERRVLNCQPAPVNWPEWITPGKVCTGTVTSVRPFGAFVDIGPVEGLIHISEISWGRVRHPRDFLTADQEVQVIILNVDPEQRRVGLSLKRLTENPWDSVDALAHPGDVLEGTVVGLVRFGVFVELFPGLEGLLHISELKGCSTFADLRNHYEIGQTLSVRVLDVVPAEHRIALELVQAAPEAEEAEGIPAE